MLTWAKTNGIDLAKLHELEVPAEERLIIQNAPLILNSIFHLGKELWGLAYGEILIH